MGSTIPWKSLGFDKEYRSDTVAKLISHMREIANSDMIESDSVDLKKYTMTHSLCINLYVGLHFDGCNSICNAATRSIDALMHRNDDLATTLRRLRALWRAWRSVRSLPSTVFIEDMKQRMSSIFRDTKRYIIIVRVLMSAGIHVELATNIMNLSFST
jgi:hypothetical protein